jgi:hypothetical protein
VTSRVRQPPDERGTAFIVFLKAASRVIPLAAALQNILCALAPLLDKVTPLFIPEELPTATADCQLSSRVTIIVTRHFSPFLVAFKIISLNCLNLACSFHPVSV